MVTHFELCKLTAEWAAKKDHVCIYDYQSFAHVEFPDALAYNNWGTTLYEIKVSRSDFLSDAGKDCRKNLRPHTVRVKARKTYDIRHDVDTGACVSLPRRYGTVDRIVKQEPHLGRLRYYVCPWGMIKPDEVELFGLYWYREKDGKFFKKKSSEKFMMNIHAEQCILMHAMRKYVNTGEANVIVKEYK